MSFKPETVAAVKKLVTLADKIDKAKKKVDTDFGDAKSHLPEAIKNKQRSMIDLHLKTLGVVINECTDALADADQATVLLADIADDEEFLADTKRRDQVDKAGRRVEDARTALTQAFTDAKRLQNVGEKGMQLAVGTEQDKVRELARLDRGVKAHKKEARDVYLKAEAINTKASQAAEARNAKALSAAQKELLALPLEEANEAQKQFLLALDRFEKEAASSKLAPEVVADLKDGVNDLRAELKGAAVYVDRMLEIQDRLVLLDIAETDSKKALKVLDLDAKFEGKLKKALDGPPAARVKALDAIAKEAALDTDGKAMVAALVRQKVIVA